MDPNELIKYARERHGQDIVAIVRGFLLEQRRHARPSPPPASTLSPPRKLHEVDDG